MRFSFNKIILYMLNNRTNVKCQRHLYSIIQILSKYEHEHEYELDE